MLHVSLFFKNERLALSSQYVEKHRRVAYHNDVIDLQVLLQDQVRSRSEKNREKVLVTGKIMKLLKNVLSWRSL